MLLWFLQQLPPSLLLCTHFSPAVHKAMQRLIDLESLTTNSYLLKKAKQLSVDISYLRLIEMNVEEQDDKEEEKEEEEQTGRHCFAQGQCVFTRDSARGQHFPL